MTNCGKFPNQVVKVYFCVNNKYLNSIAVLQVHTLEERELKLHQNSRPKQIQTFGLVHAWI